MKRTSQNSVSCTLNQNQSSVAIALDSFIESCANLFNAVRKTALVQKTLLVVNIFSTLYTTFYALIVLAFMANALAVIFGGTAGTSANVLLELLKIGAVATPFTAMISFSFLKKIF